MPNFWLTASRIAYRETRESVNGKYCLGRLPDPLGWATVEALQSVSPSGA